MSHPQSPLGGPPHQTGNLFPDHFRRALIPVAIVAIGIAIGWYLQRDDGSEEGPAKAGSSVSVKVDRVVDGDTAKVFYEGQGEYVRYIGIDTPESVRPDFPVECYGEQATQQNAELLERHPDVELVFDEEKRDGYGRLLAYVYSGGVLLQAELLRGGYATTLEIQPNTSRAIEFSRLENQARAAGRGLWSACPGRSGG